MCHVQTSHDWFDTLFRQIGEELVVKSLKSRDIDDTKLRQFIAFLVSQRIPRLRRSLGAGQSWPLVVQELDLGDNRIGNDGVVELATALVGVCIELRVLKLHKNRISSAGARAIAMLLRNIAKPPHEVHLSHNYLGPADARRMFVAMARRPEYPLGGRTPLWMRLERQQDTSLWDSFEPSDWQRWELMKEMVAFAENKLLEIRKEEGLSKPHTGDTLICQVLYRRWQSGDAPCCAFRCEHSRADGKGPILHLPYMWDQGHHVRVVKPHSAGAYCPWNDNHSLVPASALMRPAPTSCGTYPSKFTKILKLEPSVLYESDAIMVLNKGPHWLCTWNGHNSSRYWTPGGKHENSRKNMRDDQRSWQDIVNSPHVEHLDAYIARRYKDDMACSWWDYHSLAQEGAGCIHRLDRETSGCLIRAKTRHAHESLLQQIRKQTITKIYLGLVHGEVPSGRELLINDCIGVDEENNEAFVDLTRGDWAETKVRCLARYHGDDGAVYSMCEMKLISGRTHQIRVHMTHKRHPLVSDTKYGSMLAYKDRRWCPRLFLHAFSITLRDGQAEHSAVAPLSDDLRRALACLKLKVDFTAEGVNGNLHSMIGNLDKRINGKPEVVSHAMPMLQEKPSANESYRSSTDNGTAAPDLENDQDALLQARPAASENYHKSASTVDGGLPLFLPDSISIKLPKPPAESNQAMCQNSEDDQLTQREATRSIGKTHQPHGELSPRALQTVSLCVREFACEHNRDVDHGLAYTISKLQKQGLLSIESLMHTPEEKWPKDKHGEPLLPKRLTDMIRRRAEVLIQDG